MLLFLGILLRRLTGGSSALRTLLVLGCVLLRLLIFCAIAQEAACAASLNDRFRLLSFSRLSAAWLNDRFRLLSLSRLSAA